MDRLISIQALNALDGPDRFADAVRPLFEAATPLARALYAGRPFSSYEAVLRRAEEMTQVMSFEDQVSVLSAHPRIGADPASLSPMSLREQGYLADRGAEEPGPESLRERLARLNRAYERRFGFRFVIFVNRRSRAEVAAILEARLTRGRDEELRRCLTDFFLIARDRLRSVRWSGVACFPNVQHHRDDPAWQAVFDELQRGAVATYGEERSAEAALQSAIDLATTAVWRVSQETLEPSGHEPLLIYA
ncbi:MAG TPA: 2-oxo-4-hydroxy-4-carboxy-5-ureidoimidazoline decarboxylase [Chloroflexota bacterium]